MTDPLQVDVTGISEPLPDLAHEAIRVAVLNAISIVLAEHAALDARVTALENPTPQGA